MVGFAHTIVAAVTLCIMLSAAAAGAEYFSKEDLAQQDNLIFTDRYGEMLHFFPDSKGQRHLWTEGRDIPDHLKKAFIAIEDERFYAHSGVDIKAILRALKDNVLHGGVVSGASTISQQTARLIHPHPRTLSDKLREMSMSRELEELLNKDEILEQYLNRVPLGPGIAGVGLAARIYFDRKPSDLSLAQAALIASLPKAPSYYNPYGKNLDQLIARKDRVLAKMASLGFITEEQYRAAKAEPLRFITKKNFPNYASHTIEMLKAQRNLEKGIQRTTIDLHHSIDEA
jgi:membrane peptidoglycan carboxypeptidase